MAVYGEEHLPVDLSRGLYITPSPDYIPEGGTMQQYNFLQTERSTWEVRKGFTDIADADISTFFTTPGFQATARFPIPENEWAHLVNFHALVGGTGLPQLLMSYWASAGGGRVEYLHNTGRRGASDTVDFNTQLPGSGYQAEGAAQYKDRIYIITPSHQVVRVTNWKYDGTAPALTVSLLATNTAGAFQDYSADSIVSYADRMFASFGSRVWYTDIPTSGGYPETWGASNFFDLPPDNTGMPSITRMLHLNGLLYIFTDKGIYVLNGKGSSSTWRVDFISSAIKVLTTGNVALVNNVFICTDRKYLYLFDGTSIKKIGEQVQYLFEIYNSFSISPFEKGFILSCRYILASGGFWRNGAVPGADDDIWPNTKCLYFDGEVWTEIVTTAIGNTLDVLFGAVGKSKSSEANENLSFICYYDNVLARFGFAYYNRGVFQDTLNGSTYGIDALIRSRYITSGIFNTYMRIKRWYARGFSLVGAVQMRTYINGIFTDVTDDNVVITSQADNNYMWMGTGPDACTRISVEIGTASTGTRFNTSAADSVPCFELKEVILEGNQNIRTATELTTT